MSKYLYTLCDYHAIKEASILIDGITVISGINGSGKSTLSKWLYYLVNGVNNFDKYLYDDYVNNVTELVRQYRFIARDLLHSFYRKTFDNNKQDEYRDTLDFFESVPTRIRLLAFHEALVDKVEALFNKTLERMCDLLSDYLKSESEIDSHIRRALHFIGIDDLSVKTDDIASLFLEKQKEKIHALQEEYIERKEHREKSVFLESLRKYYDMSDSMPEKYQLREDDVILFEGEGFGHLYNLNRAIYVDTPIAISGCSSDNKVFWRDFQHMMTRSKDGFVATDKELKKMIFRIKEIIHGDVVLKEDDFGDEELHLVRNDGLDIKIEDIATGMKSFSYIMQLLQNGYLDDKTLLMIDEPEAHLHPQWIVEFAHLLVLLNKELRVKILVNSHNPDMVQALQSIARKEDVEDNTHFYLAEPADENEYTYRFVNQGKSIEGIFKSFNLAYQKIEKYGDSSL